MDTFPKIRKENLIAFSKEHLYYEIWMLYGVTQLLKKRPKDDYVYNALLESFVVHASVILDFFYKPQINKDDAKALHYIEQIDEWKKVIPSFNEHFDKFNKKRNREVMHLSYKRLEVRPYQKTWSSLGVAEKIVDLVNLFLKYADPEVIHPKLYELQRRKLTN